MTASIRILNNCHASVKETCKSIKMVDLQLFQSRKTISQWRGFIVYVPYACTMLTLSLPMLLKHLRNIFSTVGNSKSFTHLGTLNTISNINYYLKLRNAISINCISCILPMKCWIRWLNILEHRQPHLVTNYITHFKNVNLNRKWHYILSFLD